jgi:hypothetical protein
MPRITAADKIAFRPERCDLMLREGPMWVMSDFESLLFIELVVVTVALALLVLVAR